MSSLRHAGVAALFCFAAGAGAQPSPAPAPSPHPGAPQPPPDVAVTAEAACAVATDLAGKLEQNYVFPDVAHRYADMLRANVSSGAYDGFTSGRALAERLSADLRAVSPDAHLRVRAGPPIGGGRRVVVSSGPAGAAPAAAPPRAAFPWKPIEESRWLAPGIAYIRFNVFPGDPDTVAAVRQFMIDHADAKVIIFDN